MGTTVKKIENGDAWIVNMDSDDASGGAELVAAVSGKSHYIERVAMGLDVDGTVEILDGLTDVVGPWPFKAAGGNSATPIVFKTPMKLTAGAALNAAATAGNVCVVIEGFTR